MCRSDRGLVVRVTCVQSKLYILYYRCGGEHLSSYVHVIVCRIYTYSLPLFIQWFQFIYHVSTVCLHFTCKSGYVGGLRACLRSGLLQVWCGNAFFSISVCASVELWGVWWTNAAGVEVGISMFFSLRLESLSSFQYLCSFLCMYDLSYIYMSFNWWQTDCRGSSEFVLQTGNSLAGNLCVFASVCLSSMYSFVYSLFQVLVISLLCLLLPSIVFIFQVLGENPLEMWVRTNIRI